MTGGSSHFCFTFGLSFSNYTRSLSIRSHYLVLLTLVTLLCTLLTSRLFSSKTSHIILEPRMKSPAILVKPKTFLTESPSFYSRPYRQTCNNGISLLSITTESSLTRDWNPPFCQVDTTYSCIFLIYLCYSPTIYF